MSKNYELRIRGKSSDTARAGFVLSILILSASSDRVRLGTPPNLCADSCHIFHIEIVQLRLLAVFYYHSFAVEYLQEQESVGIALSII